MFMSVRIALSCAVICSVSIYGCASKKPIQPQNHSDVPLVEAARHAYSGKVQALVSKGTDVNRKDKRGRTALMEAASVNDAPAVKLLIQRGAKVDLKDNGGSTALLLAAASGNTESARVLLEHKANVNIKGRVATPLIAAVDNRIEIAKGYPGAGRPVELLDTIKLLLAHGADVHAKRYDGKTALALAKKRNLKNTIDLLQKAGAKY